MSYVFQSHYRECGEPVLKLALDCIAGAGIKAHVLEDWQHTARCVTRLDRHELYCVEDSGEVLGVAIVAVEDDFNLGPCVSVVALHSRGNTKFVRHVLAFAARCARQMKIGLVAYTKAISRLRYELRYLEVKHG